MDSAKKKELINSYKRKRQVGAVYAIDCAGNGRRLVKSTVDVGGIQSRYNFAISIQGCPDPALQREWAEYGSATFSLTILEELPMKEDQTSREFADEMKVLLEMWLEKLTPGENA